MKEEHRDSESRKSEAIDKHRDLYGSAEEKHTCISRPNDKN